MNSELENAINLVFQKTGRNVACFQMLESLYKRITALSQISSPLSEFQKAAQKQIDSVNKKSLGQVASLFLENVISGDSDAFNDPWPDSLKEPLIKFECKISGEDVEKWNKRMSGLIDDRNKMIHHFDQVCDLTSLESCKKAEGYLDSLHKSLIPEIKNMESALKAHQASLQVMALFCFASVGIGQLPKIG